MNALGRAEAWLFGPESPLRLRVVHTGLAVLLGLRIALGPYAELAGQDPSLFDPPWFLALLSSMPSVSTIVAIQALGVAGAMLALTGPERRRRIAYALAWGALLILAGLRASRGKVMHNDLLLLFCCVPFLAAPLDTSADRNPSSRFGWPIRTAMVVIAVAYFRAGLGKVLTAGPLWVFSDNMRWIMRTAARHQPLRAPTDAVSSFVVDQPWLAVLLAGGVLAFELSGLAILWWARWRVSFVVGAALLHAGTWMTIGLDYWTWAAVVALVLVDWPAVVRSRLPAVSAARAR